MRFIYTIAEITLLPFSYARLARDTSSIMRAVRDMEGVESVVREIGEGGGGWGVEEKGESGRTGGE